MIVTPFENGFGAQIDDIPANLRVSDSELKQIVSAWHKHSILRFRDLQMTPDEHIAFTRRIGPLHIMQPMSANLEGHPEIFVISNASKEDPSSPVSKGGTDAGLRRVGEGFHTDGEDKIVPNAGSFLYAKAVPPERGDTLWVDMYAVYEALPHDVKVLIAGRRSRFSRIDLHERHYPLMGPLTDEQKLARPDVYHPLARRHPHSGKTALYIGRWACDIEGLPLEEGQALVKYLQEFAQQPQFIFRQVWQKGDAILWDNRCTQHCATGFDDDKYVRTMNRTTLEGESPLMARVSSRVSVVEIA